MKLRTIALALSLAAPASLPAHAQSLADVVGTYSIHFQPVTSAGKLQGCSLVYKALILDQVHEVGTPVIAVGNITYYQTNNQPALSLKLGLTKPLGGNRTVEPPHHAYIRTSNGTTAGSQYETFDSDVSGYKVFVYGINKASAQVLSDLMDGVNPTIAYNRKVGGLDATFTLDLSVEDTDLGGDGKPRRKHSTTASTGFTRCFMELANSL